MKKCFLFSCLCLCVFQLLWAQMRGPFPYKFSSTIYDNIKIDSNLWLGGVTSSDLSFIGLYKEALIEWDKPRQGTRKITSADSLQFVSNYKPVNAKKFILERAKKEQIIILNEAHYNPRHRVFLTSLLEGLKKLGYNYFLSETFANDSSFQGNSKLPNLNAGYYSKEPQFGNLIREANRLKYSLFPYEDTTDSNGKNREIGQARNIAAILKKDPNGKLIIYCGFSHIYEDSVRNWEKAMAGRVKEYTGIDPFTIDQIVLSEKSESLYENPYFKTIRSSNYAILADKDNNPFNKRFDKQQVDALLYSPPTKYIYNRPDWVFENGKKPYFLNFDSIHISFPLIAIAYLKQEDIENLVVPIDVIEIKDKESVANTAIAVYRKTNFIVQLIDSKGESQIIKPKK